MCHCDLIYLFPKRNLCYLHLCSLYTTVFSHLAVFKIFSFTMVLSNLIIMCLSVVFFMSLVLGFCWDFWVCFHGIWKILAIISLKLFCHPSFTHTLLLQKSDYMHAGLLEVIPYFTGAVFNLNELLLFSSFSSKIRGTINKSDYLSFYWK